MNETLFLYGPLITFIVLLLLGLMFYKVHSLNNQGVLLEKIKIYSKEQYFIIFVLSFILASSPILYSYIGYVSLESVLLSDPSIVLDQDKMNLFLGSIYFTLLLNISIFYGILVYIYKSTKNNYKQLLPISIICFAVAESISIIGLVILFDYISKIS